MQAEAESIMTGLELIKKSELSAIAGVDIDLDDALALMELDDSSIFDLIASANRVRRHYKGDVVSLCSIINAKSGSCKENCSFCSQSVHADTEAPEFDLVAGEKIIDGAKDALTHGAHKFGIVTSGYGFAGGRSEPDLDRILESISEMKENVEIGRCASLGVIDYEGAKKLKEAGLMEYHHNLETARSFFPNVCTTHDYDEDVETVKAVKQAGLKVCCGGIFGLGENRAQRVELAFALRDLDVDSVPLNFLNPIEGTKLENAEPLPPFEILKIIAVYRLILPDKDIKVAGGREKNLRDLQCLIFSAGANSTMVGNYLTTKGRSPEDDLAMIADLGLTVKEVS